MLSNSSYSRCAFVKSAKQNTSSQAAKLTHSVAYLGFGKRGHGERAECEPIKKSN